MRMTDRKSADHRFAADLQTTALFPNPQCLCYATFAQSGEDAKTQHLDSMMRYSLPGPFQVRKLLNKTGETAMDTKNVSPVLTAEIVGSYVRHHKVDASQLPDLIATVHLSLGGLGQQPIVGEAPTPAVSVR